MEPFETPREWKVCEQVIEDPVSGLVFQFEVLPDGQRVLRVFGDLPHGNREFFFNHQGQEDGSGTAMAGPFKPTWFCRVEEGV